MMMRASTHFALILCVKIFCVNATVPLFAADLTYEQHIRPIFRAHCFDCHGATEDMEGGLDLRQVRLMRKGGDSGSAIVANRPEDSYLVERIRSGEMPPGDHRISSEEIETISRWIAAGAKTARAESETIGSGLGITPEERDFWSFRPIRRPLVREIDSFPPEARVRTPIDALLQTKFDGAAGEFDVTVSPDADRRTLILRAHFDLIGLPPTRESTQRWIDEKADDWYDRMLSELLDSPHYGERWARHWLDVAGYADSEGYTVTDAERSWAWRYRDWVIASLNRGKPFDQFLIEQLAGDELAGPRTGDLTAEQIDLLTATGFLRMAADGTGSGANHAEGRNQVIVDTLKIVGTSLFGLSLQCAQCHDHRYDPIPQSDYYAIRAVFEPALDWQAWQVPNARRVSLSTAEDREKSAAIEAEAKTIAAAKAEKLAAYMKQALDEEMTKYEEPLRAQLRQAYETVSDKRTEDQKELLAKNPSVNITPGNLYQYIPESKPKLAEFDKQIGEVRTKKPAESFVRALVEPAGHAPETKLFHRGDHRQPKQTVRPAALAVAAPEGKRVEFALNDSSLATTGRRLALARWMTGRENPMLARVIVNRVWMHHFGKGLVATPSDFGKLGARPTHPELLDWLADEFMSTGWNLKRLHRLIMTSTAWRARSDVNSPFRSLRRLEAETIRDRMLHVAGVLDESLFGPPLKIKEDDTGQIIVDGEQSRRSLYVQARRSRPVGMMQSFDAPVMETNCESRSNSTVATQSLMLLNGEFILSCAAKFAERTAEQPPSLTADRLAPLPDLPKTGSPWQYGFGSFDESKNRTDTFTALPHWTGTQWQGSEGLPDGKLGWALLHATGGHPDGAERSVIRRWTATSDGVLTIEGKLSHGSAAGDGVRGRIVSSGTGKLGEWTAHNGSAPTTITGIEVKSGDTVDFLTDCRGSVTSDSFTWPVQLKCSGQRQQTISSVQHFSGPPDSVEEIPGRIVRAWQLAYCREPSDNELLLGVRYIADQIVELGANPQAVPAGRTAVSQAMTNLCQTLLSSNEFLYVE